MTMIRNTLLGATLCSALATTAIADEASKLVTVVTSDNAQTQLMAMVLTTQAVEQGADAHILLCGPGGDLALIDAPKARQQANRRAMPARRACCKT